MNEQIFQLSQKLYKPDGVLLGEITAITYNNNGYPGLERAAVKRPDGTLSYVLSDALKQGSVCTRKMLQVKGIGRQDAADSPETPALGVYLGSRLYQSGIFVGAVVALEPMLIGVNPQSKLYARTTHGQAIMPYALETGMYSVGRRNPRSITPPPDSNSCAGRYYSDY